MPADGGVQPLASWYDAFTQTDGATLRGPLDQRVLARLRRGVVPAAAESGQVVSRPRNGNSERDAGL